MPITINGSGTITGISAGGLPDGIITAADIASGQVFSLNGVQFPASQVASADANTLDDYEEGTFTPTISGLTIGNGTITGTYTKIGRVVSISIDINWGSTTSSTNILSVGNFPFPSSSAAVMNGSLLKQGVGFYTAANFLSNGSATATSGMNWAANASYISGTNPVTWANSDRWIFSIVYTTS